MAGRVLFMAWPNQHPAEQQPQPQLQQQQQPQPQQQQQQQPREVQVDARPQSSFGHAPLDYGLLVLVGMTLLWAFPWPHNGLVDFIPHLASQVEDRDPLVLLVLLVLLVILGACVFQFFVRPARSELHRQVARIPVVTWRPLHHQAPCDGANDVTHVDVCNLSAGGWPVDKQRIFVRLQVAGQWRRLQELLVDEDHSTLKVEGPPGTGKSTVTWAWACYVAQQRSVVWVHCDQHDRNMIALLGGGCISWWTLEPERANELVAVAKGVALWVGATLLIVDGVTAQTSTLLTSAAQWATAIPGRHAVTVSSSQFVVRNHIARNLRLDVMTIFSWDFDEYVAACRDDDPFWEQVKVILGWVVEGNRGEIDDHNEHQGPFVPMQEDEYKAVLIRRKFSAAGHSARWMFFETLQQLTDTIIPTTVERVDDFQTLNGNTNGARADAAVNQLVSMFRGNGMFHRFQLVSRFVTRYVSERCELGFLTAAMNANANPAFDGWVFELEFLCRVRLAQASRNDNRNYVSIYEQDNDNSTTELRVLVHQRVFFGHSLEAVGGCDIVDGTWFIPLEWNQGGYDAAMYHARCLFFFQLTRNTSHSEKWTPMNALASAVHDRLMQQGVADGLQFVEHIYVLPPNLVGAFEFRPPQQIQSIPAWRHTHTRKVAFVRVAGGGNAPEPSRSEIITSRGQACPDQQGGLFSRAPGNHDWRRNFPLRPD
eukprot:INCI4969.10.p1 GENE.INCI4969.10~~INCI4969.10.p1  ORF type:complete len:764 (-),score=110.16 INCI4969.10:50-2176(-)